MARAQLSIPTLERTLSEQADLARLCADRPLVTREVFQPNAYYGFDWVLRSYAGLPADRALKVVIPHGIELNENHVWSAEAHAPLPAVLCYSPRQVRAYARQTDKITLSSCAPFLHVSSLLAEQPVPARQGTLFFLSHSSHRVTAVSAFDQLAQQLESLPQKFQPVSVCIYWRDFLLGHHREFARRGLRIVSAGHMYDPHFLVRLHQLCSMHRYACSNELGSHLFYSVKAGCSYFQMGIAADLHIEQAHYGADIAAIPDPIRSRFEQAFRVPHDRMTAEQLALVDDYVGKNYELSRDDMRELLLFCEKLDRFGTGCWRGTRYYTAPRALHRWLWLGPRRLVGRALPRRLWARKSNASA